MPDLRLEHANRSSGLYSTITVCLFAIVTTTILRIAAKVKYRIPFRWDDWFMVLGTVKLSFDQSFPLLQQTPSSLIPSKCINVVANAFNYKATASGFGRHPEYLTFDELVTTDKYLQLSVCLAVFANCAIKMSICFFLLGIIKGTHVVFVRLIWIVMAIVTATTFIGTLLWGLQAKPLPKLWDPNVHGTRDSPEGFLVMVYVNESDCPSLSTPTPSYPLLSSRPFNSQSTARLYYVYRSILRTCPNLFPLEHTNEPKSQDTNPPSYRFWHSVSSPSVLLP